MYCSTEASQKTAEEEDSKDKSDSKVDDLGIAKPAAGIVSIFTAYNYVFKESIQF